MNASCEMPERIAEFVKREVQFRDGEAQATGSLSSANMP